MAGPGGRVRKYAPSCWRACQVQEVDVEIDEEGVWQGAGGRGWAKRTADVVMVQEVDEEGVGTVRKGEGHAKGASQGAWPWEWRRG